MNLRQPKSMDECVYFTRRALGQGQVKVWVFREICNRCGKGLIGKPKDQKTGRAKIRAKEYSCTECGHSIPEKEYEETLTANVEYTCQHCEHSGGIQIPFKRKKIPLFNEETQKKKSVDALRFQCEKCGKNIDITKKMR